jgi:hypothetical protein
VLVTEPETQLMHEWLYRQRDVDLRKSTPSDLWLVGSLIGRYDKIGWSEVRGVRVGALREQRVE